MHLRLESASSAGLHHARSREGEEMEKGGGGGGGGGGRFRNWKRGCEMKTREKKGGFI